MPAGWFGWLFSPVAQLWRERPGEVATKPVTEKSGDVAALTSEAASAPENIDASGGEHEDVGRPSGQPSGQPKYALWGPSSRRSIRSAGERRSHLGDEQGDTCRPGRQILRGETRKTGGKSGRASKQDERGRALCKGNYCRRSHLFDVDDRGMSKGDGPGRLVMRAKMQSHRSTSNLSNLPSATQLPLPSTMPSRTENMARRWARRKMPTRASCGQSWSPMGDHVGTALGGITEVLDPRSEGGSNADKREVVEPGTGNSAADALRSCRTMAAPTLPGLLAPKLGAPGRAAFSGFALPPPMPKEESDNSSSVDDSDGDGSEGGVAEPPKPAPPPGVPDLVSLNAGVVAALARASASRHEQNAAALKPIASPQKLPVGPFAPTPGPAGGLVVGRRPGFGFALPPPMPKEESDNSSSEDDSDGDGGEGGMAEPPKPAPPPGVPDLVSLNAGVVAALARANVMKLQSQARKPQPASSPRDMARLSARADREATRDRPQRQVSIKALPVCQGCKYAFSLSPGRNSKGKSDERDVVSL